MRKLFLNITDESDELLDRVEIEVTDDMLYPIGGSLVRADIMAQVEDAAKTVQARASKGHYEGSQ